MKLAVKVIYASRVLAQIARMHGTRELAHADSLARLEAVPPNYLAQILAELREGGLITSRRGKAGGYALQGYGEVYVRHIAGSYSNVVGLPLAETRVLLKSGGYSIA